MNFAFAGTPGFAAWVLADLVERGRRPSLVITQPDRPCGRGRKVSPPPVASVADCLGLECIQTADINSEEILGRLHGTAIPVLVVAAFGQMLRRPLLDSLLCLNIHASLLPAYRGAAPIERALAAGEDQVGVTIMRITEKLDEGPWALRKAVSVALRDDAGSIGRMLALAGAIGIDQVLTGISDATVTWTEQVGPASGYADKLRARDCELDTGRGAKSVHDQVRSLSPDVGVRASCGGLQFKVWRTWPYGQEELEPVPQEAGGVAGSTGRVSAEGGRLFVGCADGAIEILALQPAGKGEMTAAAFLRGYKKRLGDRLDRPGGADRQICDD